MADLGESQFALLTFLRVAGAAPAFLSPDLGDSPPFEDGRLTVSLVRDTVGDPLDSDEAIGTSLAVFEYEGRAPDTVVVDLPGGATFELRGP